MKLVGTLEIQYRRGSGLFQMLALGVFTLSVFVVTAWSEQRQTPAWAAPLLSETRESSYPELRQAAIEIRPFANPSDYFQARFSVESFFFARRVTFVLLVNVNPILESASLESRRAIVAHELAHILYYSRLHRLQLLQLACLSNGRFRERFEKQADREAIARGYASGLKAYRSWLYQHVPTRALPEKKRDYLTPDEIDALMLSRQPATVAHPAPAQRQ